MIKYVCDRCGEESLDEDSMDSFYLPLAGRYLLCKQCKTIIGQAYCGMKEAIDKAMIELVRKEIISLYNMIEVGQATDIASGKSIDVSDSMLRRYMVDLAEILQRDSHD